MDIYTDGAIHLGVIGWGFVAVKNNKEFYSDYGRLDGPEDLLKQRNVAGELAGSIRAIKWAAEQGVKKIRIVHDYEGCAEWPNGNWEAKNIYTQKYAAYVNKMREQIAINFKHVPGHSGVKWNERADELAKIGARTTDIQHAEILTHPNIPKPLHGLNPRTILGKDWWNETREKAYISTNYHCYSCGVHKDKAKFKQHLEAHESYTIDYKKGIVEIHDIVPLCHSCHSFIHSGLLRYQLRDKVNSMEKTIAILEHGLKTIYFYNEKKRKKGKKKLKVFFGTFEFAENLALDTYNLVPYRYEGPIAEWENWRLVLEGKEYKSKFKSFEDWQKHYSSQQ